MTALGILTEDGHKLSWSRCSRTDRGVHAMRNVVSFCARINRLEFDEFRQAHQLASRLNEVLPEDIRILSVFRAPMSFAARAAPFGRFYNYFVPLWALTGGHDERSSAALEAFRVAINQFEGTHYFHNFTTPKLRSAHVCRRASGVVFDSDSSHDGEQVVHDDFVRFDDSAFVDESHWEFKPQLQRTVFHASVSDPECIQSGSPPVVRVKLFGNSFMMHQIRFMMGISIGIAAGVYPPDFIQKALVLPRFPMLPLAPAELLLQTDVKFINECLVNMVDESGYPTIRPPGIGDMELKLFRASKGVTPETLLPGVVCLNQDAIAAEAAFFQKQVAPDIAAFAAGGFPEGYDNKRASLLPAWIEALHAQKEEVATTALKVDNRYYRRVPKFWTH